MKKWTLSSIAAWCLFFAAATFAQNPERPERFGIDLRINLFGSSRLDLKNVPLNFRQIPVNPDANPDDFACNPQCSTVRTVNDSAVNPLISGISIAPILAIRAKSMVFKAGPEWLIPIFPYSPGDPVNAPMGLRGDMREENQFGGTARGVGMSLTYYSAVVRPSLLPGIVIEMEKQASAKLILGAGISYSDYDLKVEQGYDRYNSLQKFSVTPLATVFDFFPNLILGIGSIRDARFTVSAGPVFRDGHPSSFAPGFHYSERGFMLRMGIGLRVPFPSFHKKQAARLSA
jgi:hypothetical protein